MVDQMGIPHGDSDERANQNDSEVLVINLDNGKDCSDLIVDAADGAYPNWIVEHRVMVFILNLIPLRFFLKISAMKKRI